MNNDPYSSNRGDTSPRKLIWLLLPLAVLVVGVLIALWLLFSGPKARLAPATRNTTLVEVAEVTFSTQQITVEAMGTVLPGRKVELKPRVGGAVEKLSPELLPGGLFRTGEPLLQLDPTDYRLAVRRARARLAEAEAQLQVEAGNQSIARRELDLLGEVVTDEDRDLVLRRPQLATVSAAVDAARAELVQAELDLERTVIRAPFDAVVQDRHVNQGMQVSEATPLVTLISTDQYWVEVLLPVNQLRWLRIPGSTGATGSPVRIYDPAAWGETPFRSGRVLRLAADLEEQGRMARLLVAVDDPLGLARAKGEPRLLVGSYVRVEIDGVELDDVAAVPRNLIREGDRVWVMDAQNKLDIRPVEIVYRRRDTILIRDGIRADEHLVVTDLATPVQGMTLRTAADAPPAGARE